MLLEGVYLGEEGVREVVGFLRNLLTKDSV
jgi:hypothetical protein